MTGDPVGGTRAVEGVMEWFDADEGWGVVGLVRFRAAVSSISPASRCRATGSCMPASGVWFTFESLDFLQDGCPYRALAVWLAE